MELTRSTYTAPPSIKHAAVGPIFDAWRDIAADFLDLAQIIRGSMTLDYWAEFVAIPVWRSWWDPEIKRAVLQWFGRFFGEIFTIAGITEFCAIFGGDVSVQEWWQQPTIDEPVVVRINSSTRFDVPLRDVVAYVNAWKPQSRTIIITQPPLIWFMPKDWTTFVY